MKKSLLFSFGLIGEIGIATALPLAVFGLIGRYLDKTYGTGNTFLIIGIALATVQVYFYLKRIVKKASEQFSKINEESKSKMDNERPNN